MSRASITSVTSVQTVNNTTMTNSEGRSVPVVSSEEVITENHLRREIFQHLIYQRKFFSRFLDENKSRTIETIGEECGYPETGQLTVEHYRHLYDRDPIPAKVVDIYPKYCWQVAPEILEDDQLENVTEFEKAFTDMCKGLYGRSFYEGNVGNRFWNYLHRADRMSRIGRYGVILLGLDDGKELNEPATFAIDPFSPDDKDIDKGTDKGEDKEDDKEKPKRKLLFMRVFDEQNAKISRWDKNRGSNRYGLPEMYTLTVAKEDAGDMLASGTQEVHWTRVIHISEGLQSNEVMGTPALQAVYNRCLDLYKLYGSSCEMYYHGAFPGLSFETHPELGDEIEIDAEAMREQIVHYQKRLQRYLATKGMTVKSLAPQVVDPTPNIHVEIEAICIHIECPKRIFMGSERGELSSDQDAKNWFSNVRGRQVNHCIPNIIVPSVDRLICLGVLPVPEQYRVSWPDLETSSDSTKADVAVKRTQAIVTYVSGEGEALIDPLDFLVRILGFTEREGKEILDNREANELLRLESSFDNNPEDQIGENPFGTKRDSFVDKKSEATDQQERTNSSQKVKRGLAGLDQQTKEKRGPNT